MGCGLRVVVVIVVVVVAGVVRLRRRRRRRRFRRRRFCSAPILAGTGGLLPHRALTCHRDKGGCESRRKVVACVSVVHLEPCRRLEDAGLLHCWIRKALAALDPRPTLYHIVTCDKGPWVLIFT